MNFLEQMRQREIVVWGAGQEGNEFFSEWEFYSKNCQNLIGGLLPKITTVWDSSPIKQGTLFHDCKVEAPNLEDFKKEHVFLVIAIMNYSPVEKILKRANLIKDADFKVFRSFLATCRYCLLDYAKEILLSLNIPCDDIERLSFSQVQAVYSKIEDSILNDDEKIFAQDIFLGFILKNKIANGWVKETFIELKKHLPLSGIISALSMVLDRDTEDFYSFLEKDILVDKPKKSIKTIGIHNKCYSHGGGPRVLSLLIPIYLSLGYRVVFFTDEKSDDEYFLPKEVTRVVLKHSTLSAMKLRLDEYSKYIKAYNIDIICLHFLKFDITSFYEALYFKLSGITVLGEVHLMFLMVINKQNYVAKQCAQTYKLLDRLVILSNCNKTFWENLGCKATYIPNPVENGKRLWNKPISFSKRNGKSILWIGRTTDGFKRLKDVVDIMDEVRSKVSDAKLFVVGETEELSTLEQTIKERNLTENIKFCGYHSNVGEFYEEADVMLMTSEMEGFPMVLIESKLYGAPTVMYELPYLELVKDERGILPVPQGNKHKAAEAIITLLNDDVLRHKLSIEAKRSIYPFIAYDVAGAWKKVFDEVSQPLEKRVVNIEQQTIQEYLLQELWKEE